MTPPEFESLDLTEKAEAVWRGTFLGDREEGGLRIQLYSLGSCYVEAVYDPAANKIMDFRAFTSHHLLVPYLAQIRFNQ